MYICRNIFTFGLNSTFSQSVSTTLGPNLPRQFCKSAKFNALANFLKKKHKLNEAKSISKQKKINNLCIFIFFLINIAILTLSPQTLLSLALIYVVKVIAVMLLITCIACIYIYLQQVCMYVVHRQPNPMTLSQCPNLVGTGAQPASRLLNNFMHIHFYTHRTAAQSVYFT